MSSIFIVIFGLIGFSFGWFVYSKFIAEKIYQLDPNYETPAHRFEDGVDYVPTNKFVLWGSHFTAVAGAAPIVGPAIAVYWGWACAMRVARYFWKCHMGSSRWLRRPWA